MAGIGSKQFSEIYGSMLQVDNANTGVDATNRVVKDGAGNSSSVSISKNKIKIKPVDTDATDSFIVADKDNNNLLAVDSTNDRVLAGIGQVSVNTQYAYFGINYDDSQSWAANTHYAIPFGMGGYAHAQCDLSLLTGSDPSDAYILANLDGFYGAQLVPMLWYVPDNIVIEQIISIEGGDANGTDTTRMHLMAYDYASATANVLTNGVVVGNTSSDTTNAGNVKTYKNTWTLTNPSISSGKVCLCTFRSDSINNDFSANITIKYRIA